MTRVKNALDELVRLAAEDREYGVDGVDVWSRAHSMDLNEGRWKTITTLPFPGNLPDDNGGKSEFTLGVCRLACSSTHIWLCVQWTRRRVY